MFWGRTQTLPMMRGTVLMLKVVQGKVERGAQGLGGRRSYLEPPLIGRVNVLIVGV